MSAQAANRSIGVPVEAAAFHSRAPSMCTGRPCARATSAISCSVSSGVTTPPAPLCVFSKQTRLARGAWIETGRIVAASEAASITRLPVPAGTPRGCTPLIAASPACSQCSRCDSASTRTSVPRWARSQMAVWLAIVPLGK